MLKRYYTKRDIQAAITIVAMILIGCGLLLLLARYGRQQPDDMMAVDKKKDQPKYYAVEGRKVKLAPFDPNTADSTHLLALGLQPWQVRNIYRYRANGGIYRRPEDFARLYGLSAHQYKQLLPYIRIAKEYSMSADEYVGKTYNQPMKPHISGPTYKEEVRHSDKLSEGEHIALNGADTTSLKRIPGIGSWYARKIVQYGERLGGYVDVGQLLEIDGFPEEALPYVTIGDVSPRRLNANTASLSQLRRHPYINYYQAKAITDYRRLYGKISDIRQLSTCRDFTERDLERISPYIEY